MNSDIRILTTFPHHPKTKKLKRKLGADGVLSLVNLWVYAAQNRTDGCLAGMDYEDIAIAADWDNDASGFIECLLTVGFLDKKGEELILHDWREHNPYAANSEMRSRQAAKNQIIRWIKGELRDGKELDAFKIWFAEYQFKKGESYEQILAVYRSYTSGSDNGYGRNTPYPPPSPSPSPSPKPDPNIKSLFDEFWAAYPKKKNKGNAEKVWKKITVDDALQKKILISISKAKKTSDWLKEGGQYIPYPSTWLNAKGWEDECLPSLELVNGSKDRPAMASSEVT